MLKRVLPPICLLLAVVAGTSGPAVAQPIASETAAEQEIRAAADAFLASFRQRDAAALATHWTEDGVYVNENGVKFEGHDSIQAEYETLFEDAPTDLEMVLEIDSIRLLNARIAMEEGRSALVPQTPGEKRLMSRYTAVHVKQDGRWLMADVRDTLVEVAPDAGELEDLDWFVGTWSASNGDATVLTKCRWIENRQFLARSHAATKGEEEVSSGLQVIGVDPSTGQITSWMFSGNGSHAMGRWVPHDKGWIVETNGVMKDGTETSATNTLTRQDQDTLIWKSTNRTIGSATLPDTPELTLKRK